jgi:hypothetical protein
VAEEQVLKGHAENEVDAEDEGDGIIVVNYLPCICLSSWSISGSLVSVLCLFCVCLVSVGLSVAA